MIIEAHVNIIIIIAIFIVKILIAVIILIAIVNVIKYSFTDKYLKCIMKIKLYIYVLIYNLQIMQKLYKFFNYVIIIVKIILCRFHHINLFVKFYPGQPKFS